MKMNTTDPAVVPLAPGMTPLRWQTEAMLAIRRYLPEHSTVLVSAATGTGKGTLIASLIVKAARAGKRVLFLVHMDELIEDVMARAVAIEPALYAGKVKAKQNECDRHAVFASVQTLKGKRLDDLAVIVKGTDGAPDTVTVGIAGRFDFVITDEGHHATARSYRAIYDRIGKANPKYRHILFTATPFRNAGGGKTAGLGLVCEHLVYEYSLSDAITEGALCPIRGVKVYTEIDLTGVDPDDEEAIAKKIDTQNRNRVVAEKYVEHCIEGGERREVVTAEVVEGWEPLPIDVDASPLFADKPDAALGMVDVARTVVSGGDRKPAIVFACTIAHAQRLADELVKWGVLAEAVWGTDKQRSRKIGDFKAGRIDVLCNNNLLSEGFDHRPTGAVLLVRPTQSRGLYAQQVGRATRNAPGKREGLIIDFVANSDTHDLVSLADLSRPDHDKPRINPGDEVRHRREAHKSKGLVESVEGWASNDDQGVAMVLWKQNGGDDIGIVAAEAVEEKAEQLVLVVPAKLGSDEEIVINPTVIGVNEFAISLFGEPTKGKRLGWYTYTDSRKRKHLVAKGKERGTSAMIRHCNEQEWEVWRRQDDVVRLVHSGTFSACEAVCADLRPDDYTAEWQRKPATEKQLATLAKFSVRRDGLSCGEASMILELKIILLMISKGQYAPMFPDRNGSDTRNTSDDVSP